jgi:hypothetical protein
VGDEQKESMMKRIGWKGMIDCAVLVPETVEERGELTQSLEDNGVLNSLGFSKNGVNGTLYLPETLAWDSSGAMKASVKVNEELGRRSAWFWLVECADSTGRRFAWWSLENDIQSANSWT